MGQRFREQVVVITGGSAGIGLGLARAFAREGARLVLGARRKEELETAAASLRRGGRECRAIPCDVTVPRQAQALVDAGLDRWDQVDVVVANAGIGLTGDFADNSPEDLRQVFELNVFGVLHVLQAALPSMIERGRGSLVLVSSVLGYRGIPGYAGYCATKHALHGLADAIRTELEPKGIHVLLAAPGLTDTEFHERRLGVTVPEPLRQTTPGQDPDEAGRQIVRALARRRRRVTLTHGGRLFARLGRHAPRLTDALIERWHRRSQPPRPQAVPAPARDES